MRYQRRQVLGMIGGSCLAGAVPGTRAEGTMKIAENGRARCALLRQPGATPAERHAADELAAALGRITGATFEVREADSDPSGAAILVGPGPLAERHFPEVDFDSLGGEQVVIKAKGDRLLLAGGRPRGTLYAVYRFLQEQCGVRWWTPWAESYPKKRTLGIGALDLTDAPAFESRDPFWYPAFDGDWAARNFSNSQSARLTEKHGGKILYKGFVHTFYPLVPPEEHFAAHPEWYSLLGGKRTVEGGQLCTTNPELRDFVVGRVKAWLRESPEAKIVSVSQNDWHGACECPVCKAVADREGSHSGTMLALANYVAAHIKDEFPDVAVDTLAYQYTRKAPKTLRPLPNVIVRLCSIEANFGAPLEDVSNKAFADDMRDWDRVSDRLYVWDYTTNFAHYPLPHPNWFSLGPNVRFFHKHGVKGLFEQGAYQSNGGEMAEMRAWVLARLLSDPRQDDGKLIDEFLAGYYGQAAARPVREYLDLLHERAEGFYLTCYTPPTASFLDFSTLSRAERLWQAAERAVRDDPDRLWRVRQGHLPVRYAFLQRWARLRQECLRDDAEWPLPLSRKAVADEWLAVATGPGPEGWTPMTHVNESGLTPQAFVARFAVDPVDRGKYPPPPADLAHVDPKSAVEGQDSLARLAGEGRLAVVRADPNASDGTAVRMPGSHKEWAFQLSFADLDERAWRGRWDVYVIARVEKDAGADPKAPAFSAGVYDADAKANRADIAPTLSDAAGEAYRSWRIGTVDGGKGRYVWVAPPGDPKAGAVWVDAVYLVREGEEGRRTGETPGDRPIL